MTMTSLTDLEAWTQSNATSPIERGARRSGMGWSDRLHNSHAFSQLGSPGLAQWAVSGYPKRPDDFS